MDKNDAKRNTGTKNQKTGLSLKNAKNKNMPDAIEKITAWWSTKGVPTEG